MFCESKYIDSIPWMRANAPLDYDALTCLRFCGNMVNRLKYEKNLSVCKMIDTIGVNMLFGYQRTYRIIAVAPRDVYVYGFVDILLDGRYILVLFTDVDDDKPEEKGCVRMEAFGGMVFTPNKDDPSKCRMDVLQTIDIKMNLIPSYIVSQVVNLSAHGICTIQDLMPKWVKENKQ